MNATTNTPTKIIQRQSSIKPYATLTTHTKLIRNQQSSDTFQFSMNFITNFLLNMVINKPTIAPTHSTMLIIPNGVNNNSILLPQIVRSVQKIIKISVPAMYRICFLFIFPILVIIYLFFILLTLLHYDSLKLQYKNIILFLG